MATWRLYCEGPSDHRTIVGLIDRVLSERCQPWVHEALEAHPEVVRTWARDERGETWSDLHAVRIVARSMGQRLSHGHFDGEPAEPYANVVYNAVLVSRRSVLAGEIDALILVADLDDAPTERLKGLEQGRRRGQALLGDAPIVIGAPNPNREAWVLFGYVPSSPDEEERLQAERRTLGFYPNEHPERLIAMDEHAPKHTKRVLRSLIGDDAEREARCWAESDLDRVRTRGGPCGIAAFALRVEQMLCPLVDGVRRDR